MVPILSNTIEIPYIDNQAVAFIVTLFLMLVPLTMESIISHFGRVVIDQSLDVFREEVYILTGQLNMECYRIEKNKYN